MREAKNTQRSVVKIGFDGRVHKTFRGPKAEERYANEVRVLRYLEQRHCPFVPRLLDANPEKLQIITSNCGAIVQHISDDRAQEVFEELEKYGVRHDDPYARNITYRATDGRFCAIDFEFAEILDAQGAAEMEQAAATAADVSDSARAHHLKWSGITDRGTFRTNNEDAFLAMMLDKHGIRYLGKTGEADLDNVDFIFAVSDGMGGQKSGEFASRIAMEKITLQLPNQFSVPEERFLAYSGDILTELFKSIHAAMLNLGKADANCQDMGATLTLTWFRKGRVYFAHIGDSRLYHMYAAGGFEQVSEDHTHVGWLRRSGQANEREARTHPRKNVLDQALGAGHRYLNPHIGVLDYQPGDTFVLCTDGVTDGLWDHRIEDLARQAPVDFTTKAETLVFKAIAESGRDNATALVVETS